MKRTAAFSLIEVLVAVALFGVGIASLLQSFHVATRTAAHERRTTAALHAAEQVLEEMLLRPSNDSLFDVTSLFCFDRVAVAVDCADDRVAFEVEVARSDTGIPGFFEVAVTSRWADGQPRQLTLKTRRT